jgi:type I restriction enzyme R subunit
LLLPGRHSNSRRSNILENYAQIIEEKDPRTGKKKRTQVSQRYHQLGVVRQTLADVHARGAGKRYLIQHSAGSGKSNSIAWRDMRIWSLHS